MQTGTTALDLTHIRFSGRSSAFQLPRRVARPAPAVPPQHGAARAADAALVADGLPSAVLAAAGIAPTSYRAAPLERRVAACLRALRTGDSDAARQRLSDDPALLHVALDAFLIGVSSFFRDPEVFDTIAADVLPQLAAGGQRLRICSIGCSSGEELYSIAMLLAAAGWLERAELVGIDCRPHAIAAARAGRYPAAHAGTLAPWHRRFLLTDGDEVEIVSAIRERISWQLADVTAALPSAPWHLALCRNVVIYMTSTAGGRLLGDITASLAPGGVLAVGKAERPPTSAPVIPLGRCLYRRHA